MNVNIRWMIRRDMSEVLRIEERSFANPWTEADFMRSLRQRNTIGMVAESQYDIVGYMVYELHKTRIHLLNLAAHPDLAGQGIGTALVGKLKGKLSASRRTKIDLLVWEENVLAQMWLKSRGFVAVEIVRDAYVDVAGDAYLMEYDITQRESRRFKPTNRITRYTT